MAEQSYNSKVKIFALNSNKPLAKKIADAVGVPLGKTSVDRFSDGEIRINIEESIRGMKSSSSNQRLHRLMTI